MLAEPGINLIQQANELIRVTTQVRVMHARHPTTVRSPLLPLSTS